MRLRLFCHIIFFLLLAFLPVSLHAQSEGGDSIVFETYAPGDSAGEESILGRLKVVSYEKKKVSVVIVPVNGARTHDPYRLNEELDRIYKPAVAEFDVQEVDGLNDVSFKSGKVLTHGGSGTFTVYSDDEKACIEAYEKKYGKADNVYVLFYLDNVTKLTADGTSPDVVAGYMPRGYHYGFIFECPVEKYVAHELGHGAFTLKHTWEPGEQYWGVKERTDNLMDYAGGTELNNVQWGLVHEPDVELFKFLQDEEEGENISLKGKFYAVLNENNDYRLYNNSSLTVLAGTELRFSVLPDEYIDNRIKLVSQEKYNESPSKITYDTIGFALKISDIKNNNFDKAILPPGRYTCKISIGSKEKPDIKYSLFRNDGSNIGNRQMATSSFVKDTISISIDVLEAPVVRIEPVDRENYYLKFGYDDALVKEFQDRGDYETQQIGGVKYYIPWLHVQPGVEAEMKVNFIYDELFVSKRQTELESSQKPVKLFEGQSEHNTEQVEDNKDYTMHFVLKGTGGVQVNGCDSLIVTLDKIQDTLKISSSTECHGYVEVYVVDHFTNKYSKAGMLEVDCRKIKTIGTITLYSAKRNDEDDSQYPIVNSKEIIDFVNAYYVQAGLKFELACDDVKKFVIKTKNKSQVLNIANDFMSVITQKTIKELKNDTNNLFINQKHINIFLANDYQIVNSDEPSITDGQTPLGYGWVYALLGVNKNIVIVHEIGHVLGLNHTYGVLEKDPEYSLKKKTTSVMDYETKYTNQRKSFYKRQINDMYNKHNEK